MTLYRDEAVVLRTYKLGEADRIVVLYGRGHGLIRAVAKGVRRTKSKFGARLEPGSWVHGQFYDGRTLDIVTQVETATLFEHLRGDLDRHARAMLILEIIEQVGLEGDSNPALFKLLTGALSELDRSGNATVLPAFVGKVLILEGVQPKIDACVVCGDTQHLETIAIHLGGVLCDDHREGEAISEEARQALALIFDGQVRRVLETSPPRAVSELEHLSARLMEHHLERRLKSTAVLHTL